MTEHVNTFDSLCSHSVVSPNKTLIYSRVRATLGGMNKKHSWDERREALDTLKKAGWSLREIAKEIGVKERSLATAIKRKSNRGNVVPELDRWLEDQGHLGTGWDFIENPEDWINRHAFVDLAAIAAQNREVEAAQACMAYDGQLKSLFEQFERLHGQLTAIESRKKASKAPAKSGEAGG